MNKGTTFLAAAWLVLVWVATLTGCDATVAPESGVAASTAADSQPALTSTDTSASGEGTPMSAPQSADAKSPKPSDGPELAPDQVWRKLLDLIEGMRSEADLKPAHVERVIGLPLNDRSESQKEQSVSGKTTAGWIYAFELHDNLGGKPTAVFDPYVPDLDRDSDVATTCTFPFQKLHDEMVRLGFKATNLGKSSMGALGDVAMSGDIGFWAFDRSPLSVDAHFYFTEKDGAEADYQHACLYRLSMSFKVSAEAPPNE